MGGLIAIGSLVVTLMWQITYTSDTRPFIPLILATSITIAIGLKRGHTWKKLSDSMYTSISSGIPVLAVLTMVGLMVGSWVASGTISSIVKAGIYIVQHVGTQLFLPSSFLICLAAGITMGAATSVIATFGVAIVGVGAIFGFPTWLIASAVGSGAFVGNALSPIGDIANMVPGILDTDTETYLKDHWKTAWIPIIAATVLYWLTGTHIFSTTTTTLNYSIDQITTELDLIFKPGFITLIPIITVLILILKRLPALLCFFWGTLSAVLIAAFWQHQPASTLISTLVEGYTYTGTIAPVKLMLSRGGIMSMASVVIMVMFSLAYGGALKGAKLLDEVIKPMLTPLKSLFTVRLVAVLSCLLLSGIGGSSNLGIVLGSSLLADSCEEKGLSKRDFAASIGGAATVAVCLFPWAIGGAFLISVLEIQVNQGGLMYIPFSYGIILFTIWCCIMPLRSSKKQP